MNKCKAVLGTVTYAMKVQRALSEISIPSKTVKIESNSSSRGCSYAVEFACAHRKNVKTTIEQLGLTYEEYKD